MQVDNTAPPRNTAFPPDSAYRGGLRVKDPVPATDTHRMKLRTPTLDLIAKEYAEATASGDFERAEGWFATATLVAARETDRTPVTHRAAVEHSRRRALLHH